VCIGMHGAKIGIIIETAKKKRKKYFEAVRGTSAEDAD